MIKLQWLIPLLPVISALLVYLLAGRLGKRVARLSVGVTALTFLIAAWQIGAYIAGDHVPEIMAHKPVGFEGLDDRLAEFMRLKGLHVDRLDYLPKGVYVFEYSVRVQHKGQYQTGMAQIQCMYAPEFNSHSESFPLEVQ